MKENTFCFRTTLILVMIIAGSFGTISSNFQNSQLVQEGNIMKFFFHPYLQASAMFVALTICGIAYLVSKRLYPESYKSREEQALKRGLKLNMSKFHLLIPTAFDLISSTLQYTSLNFVSASIYQMMRGGTIVTTFLFSIFFLKLKIKKYQVVGALLALSGCIIVGANNIIFAQKTQQTTDKQMIKQGFGFLLICFSWITNACVLVYQQKLFSKYHLQPLYVVGVEGCFGIMLEIILISILTFTPCPFGRNACVFNDNNQPFFQRPQVYWRQVSSHPVLLTAIILSILASSLFNASGVAITKYINALARSISDITRTSLVWILGIVITITAGSTNQNYRWEIIQMTPILIQLLGFSILIFGNLTYNKFVRVPQCFKKIKFAKFVDQGELNQEQQGYQAHQIQLSQIENKIEQSMNSEPNVSTSKMINIEQKVSQQKLKSSTIIVKGNSLEKTSSKVQNKNMENSKILK